MSITYTTGNILESETEAIVNTVNCEGYMGKGLAYQFKLRFPENNKDYMKACRSGNLCIGKMHYFKENNKIIINFPTKNKWRENSKIEYIDVGLDSLIELIKTLNIKSISIPPLGSGNGGLNWEEVKNLITKKFYELDSNIYIKIYEPSKNYKVTSIQEPKLSTSALILMKLKQNLNKFTKIRLQKSAYFMNILSGDTYFKFKKEKYGPYDNSISIISKNIKEYQKYHNIENVDEVYCMLYSKIVSEDVEKKLKKYDEYIKKSCDYINCIKTEKEVECVATIVFILKEKGSLNENQIIENFKLWSEDKANRFSETEILNGVENLYNHNIIQKDLIGFRVNS